MFGAHTRYREDTSYTSTRLARIDDASLFTTLIPPIALIPCESCSLRGSRSYQSFVYFDLYFITRWIESESGTSRALGPSRSHAEQNSRSTKQITSGSFSTYSLKN